MIRALPLFALLALSACDDREVKEFNANNWRDPIRVQQDAPKPRPMYVAQAYDSNEWAALVDNSEEVKCLAWNIYFEARGTSTADQIAVAAVTLNRLQSGKFASTVCGVVFQPYQFSWTHDPKILRHKVEAGAWHKAMRIAKKAIAGELQDPTGGADHYFAHKVIKAPKWASAGYDVVELKGHRYMKLASN